MPEWTAVAVVFFLITMCLYPRTGESGRVTAQRTSLRRFLRSAGLPRSEGDAWLAERLGRRERAAAISSQVLLVLALACGLAIPALRDSSWWALALIGAVCTGRAVGPLIAALRQARAPLPTDAPRVARTARPHVGDHVAWPERAISAAMALAPAGVTAVAAGCVLLGMAEPSTIAWSTLGVLSVAAVAVPVLVSYLAALLVHAPRPATSQQNLFWEDALRARTLRALYCLGGTLALSLGMGAAIVFDSAVTGGWPENPVRGAAIGTMLVFLVLLPVYSGLAAGAAPGQRFRQRLWSSGLMKDAA
ncbi:hypothetical protein FHX37_2486 [Haloactinospora alba]|uniref:Uncharacterized protein n=1 Tax=Haloactinospora alba TaxID=405555 RepID=A0A543NL34_9ACTN|nr:hypothetical protein [Haloactinospora alba]TQN32522.1 hypothetical protein FHX37_2486 [Haloactinospora alba]